MDCEFIGITELTDPALGAALLVGHLQRAQLAVAPHRGEGGGRGGGEVRPRSRAAPTRQRAEPCRGGRHRGRARPAVTKLPPETRRS